MFLNSLSKNHKRQFMELAVKAAEINGTVELAERNMLKAYGMEMEITPIYTSDSNIEDVLQKMKTDATESELKIVLFELMGILVSDKEFDEAEKEFLEKVRNSFCISQEKCDELLKLLYEYSLIYQKIVAAVL